jgi:hypothetical protein
MVGLSSEDDGRKAEICEFLEEFDPGSEQTLAAWLRHASRTDHGSNIVVSGGRESNAWATYPGLGDNCGSFGSLQRKCG